MNWYSKSPSSLLGGKKRQPDNIIGDFLYYINYNQQ